MRRMIYLHLKECFGMDEQTVTLNNGVKMPKIGLGVWK